NGVQCFIIPNYWLSTKYDEKLREYLFQQFHTYLLLNIYSIFESATVDTLIAFTKKSALKNKSVQVLSIDRKLKSIEERLDVISKRNWTYNEIYKIEDVSKLK